ncbi:MAG: serine/threonine protein kinase [Anaerolineae bacterium]|nr:serine/threonine protein kinase [Anaerolineae bacterium]
MAVLIGINLGGRYEIRRLLGQGGMAEVYEAYQPRLDRRVAVKLMHRHLSRDVQFQARFEREARAMARLKHPHIVQVYDFDRDPELDQFYMVIEYIDGPSLSDSLHAQGGMLPLAELLGVMEALAGALGYAHAEGMQHRDIKPSNVMLDRNQRVVLMDFGIAKLVQEGGAESLTASGAMIGTPAYMPPEQAGGTSGDHRSDLYSLGIMFYQLATGRLPYEAETPLGTIMKHLSEVPMPPSSLRADLPPGVEAIILRCMAKDPVDRYQNAEALLAQLRDLEIAGADLEKQPPAGEQAAADHCPCPGGDANDHAYGVCNAEPEHAQRSAHREPA